jgi:TrmH family RNA methyltransferase
MITNAQIKFIKSLAQAKNRELHKLYVAEGEKLAIEWLQSSANVQMIIATSVWISKNQSIISKHSSAQVFEVDEQTLARMSQLQTPNHVILVVEYSSKMVIPKETGWIIALDTIQDPGNMGTILRIADWFGINTIICSPQCVDIYNHKVIQSGMGAHLRVAVEYKELDTFFKANHLPVYAALLNGENLFQVKSKQAGIILIGNESKGIAPELLPFASHPITIPRIGGAESLNAGVATGIIAAYLTS